MFINPWKTWKPRKWNSRGWTFCADYNFFSFSIVGTSCETMKNISAEVIMVQRGSGRCTCRVEPVRLFSVWSNADTSTSTLTFAKKVSHSQPNSECQSISEDLGKGAGAQTVQKAARKLGQEGNMFRVLKDHCGLLRWENTSKYMCEGHFEFTARQVCLLLSAEASYSFFFPYLSSRLADCPASKQRTALNKHWALWGLSWIHK